MKEETVASIDTVLAASRAASEQLLADAEAMATGWDDASSAGQVVAEPDR